MPVKEGPLLSVSANIILQWRLTEALKTQFIRSYLTMCINHRPKQLPGPSPAVHAHHAQNLKETKATQRRGGKDVTLATG